jgi:RNA polymerase sigma-70 factor (ECF subfamily)
MNEPPNHRTDASLLAASDRDPDAFRELYVRYAERIHAYFLRRSGDHAAALELTAETFAQAWLVRRRFDDRADGSLAPWLFGIARNTLLMSVRRGAIERRATERLGLGERLDRESTAAAPEPAWSDGADELLDALPPSQRDAVRLRVLEELDYDDVAGALGTSPAAARVRVHRGLSALRAHLSTPKETL